MYLPSLGLLRHAMAPHARCAEPLVLPPSTPSDQRLSGANFTAGPGEYPQAADTRTLSIAVPPGYAVVLYEFYRFQGRSLVVTQSQEQLPDAFRNKVSSFKVSAGEPAMGLQTRRRFACSAPPPTCISYRSHTPLFLTGPPLPQPCPLPAGAH